MQYSTALVAAFAAVAAASPAAQTTGDLLGGITSAVGSAVAPVSSFVNSELSSFSIPSITVPTTSLSPSQSSEVSSLLAKASHVSNVAGANSIISEAGSLLGTVPTGTATQGSTSSSKGGAAPTGIQAGGVLAAAGLAVVAML